MPDGNLHVRVLVKQPPSHHPLQSVQATARPTQTTARSSRVEAPQVPPTSCQGVLVVPATAKAVGATGGPPLMAWRAPPSSFHPAPVHAPSACAHAPGVAVGDPRLKAPQVPTPSIKPADVQGPLERAQPPRATVRPPLVEAPQVTTASIKPAPVKGLIESAQAPQATVRPGFVESPQVPPPSIQPAPVKGPEASGQAPQAAVRPSLVDAPQAPPPSVQPAPAKGPETSAQAPLAAAQVPKTVVQGPPDNHVALPATQVSRVCTPCGIAAVCAQVQTMTKARLHLHVRWCA